MSVWKPVRDHFPTFTKRFEGWIPWLYEDRLGLMTTGIGDLVDTQPPSADPTPFCLSLPWVRPNGSRASKQEIADAWHAVRARPDLRPKDGTVYGGVTTLRLSPGAIESMVSKKFDENDGILSARFPDYSQWPAVGQLALHSMAWALGPRFRYPKFEEAARKDPPDFALMAAQCKIPGGHPLRNSANQALFEAAGAAVRDLPPSQFAELTVDASAVFGAESAAAGLAAVPRAVGPIHPNWGRITLVLGAVSAAGYAGAHVYSRLRNPPLGRSAA